MCISLYLNTIESIETFVCVRNKNDSVEKLKLRERQKEFLKLLKIGNEERMIVVIGYHPFCMYKLSELIYSVPTYYNIYVYTVESVASTIAYKEGGI